MKAIQIKYIACTNTKPSRLKAWTDAGSLVESLDYELSTDEQAAQMVVRYINKYWGDSVIVSGFGSLPSGGWVATLLPALT